MTAQKEEILALRLERDGKEAERELLHLISQAFRNIPCYAYKSRVKSDARLIEKLGRKRASKPEYTLESITDVVGLRIVTLFRREMPEVVKQVVALINHDSKFAPNIFEKKSLREVVIYSANPNFDEIAASVKEFLAEVGLEAEIKASKEGYSSIHIVSTIGSANKVPVEIQVRTVFEDAWGEIDHKFGYVIRSGKGHDAPIKNPRYVQGHLKILKKFADACAEYADAIFEEATTDASSLNTYGKVISVASDQEVIELFQARKVPPTFIERYVEGRKVRDNAIKVYGSQKEEGQSLLIGAADFFSELLGELQEEGDGVVDPIFNYYVRMNEALCLLSTYKVDLLTAALKIYLELEDKHQNFAFLKFRIAQAYGRLGHTDRAIAKFEESDLVAKATLQKHQGQDTWPTELPKADYEYMRNLLPKMLGYQLWVKAEKAQNDPAEKAALLRKAFEVTRPLLDLAAGKPLFDVHNNLLYYAVGYLSLHDFDWDKAFITEALRPQVEQSLAALEQLDMATLSIGELDTLVRAYDFLADQGKALRAAARLVELAMHEPKTDDTERASRVLAMLTFALAVQGKYKSPTGG